MLALAAVQTAILDVPDLFRMATRQHLRHQPVVIGGLIARMGVLKRLPVIGKDLLKDTPVPGGDWDGAVVVPRHLRAVHSSSTMAITAYRSNTKNAFSFYVAPVVKPLFPIFSCPRFFSCRVMSYSTTESVHMRSRAQENRYGNASEHLSEQRRPVPSSLVQPHCSRSHDLDASGGFRGRGEPSSPTTFYPCGLSPPSPDSVCV